MVHTEEVSTPLPTSTEMLETHLLNEIRSGIEDSPLPTLHRRREWIGKIQWNIYVVRLTIS
jgi:hypothetical protein